MTGEFDKAVSMAMWTLADELSVVNAAILITGNDPSATHSVHDFEVDMTYREQTTTGHRGFDGAFNALKSAILADKLQARVVFSVDVNPAELSAVVRGSRQLSQLSGQLLSECADAVYLQWEPDWKQTMVEVEELKRWLQSRDYRPPFFFPTTETAPEPTPTPTPKVRDFTDPAHLRYSDKLACAVAAWEAITQPRRGKSVKQTISAWVKEHGAKYTRDGNPFSNQATDDIAIVANWNPGGGTPRTGAQVSGKSAQVPNSGVGPARQDQKMQPLDDEEGDEPPYL